VRGDLGREGRLREDLTGQALFAQIAILQPVYLPAGFIGAIGSARCKLFRRAILDLPAFLLIQWLSRHLFGSSCQRDPAAAGK
jgi:hypothetical protein